MILNPRGAEAAQLLPPITSGVFYKPEGLEHVSHPALEKQPKDGNKETLFSNRSPCSLKLGSSAKRLVLRMGVQDGYSEWVSRLWECWGDVSRMLKSLRGMQECVRGEDAGGEALPFRKANNRSLG